LRKPDDNILDSSLFARLWLYGGVSKNLLFLQIPSLPLFMCPWQIGLAFPGASGHSRAESGGILRTWESRDMTPINRLRTILGLALLVAFGSGVFVYYRVYWSFNKRLREVTAGKLYRSGQLTAEGFRDAIRELGIKSVVNLQDEFPDPDIVKSWHDHSTIKEIALCSEMGVKYIHLMPDLVSRNAKPGERPTVIEGMLGAYDDPTNYPMLVHCKAGLHRTGILVAIYRMEYEGWSPDQAYRELRAHGFGETVCNEANDYVREYVLEYQPGVRKGKLAAGTPSNINNPATKPERGAP